MSHRRALVLCLLLTPPLSAAAPPPIDPLPAIEARLKKDVGDRAALGRLVAFAAVDAEKGGGLRLGSARRAQLLLRRELAAQPRGREAVVKLLRERVRKSLPKALDAGAGAALLLLRAAATPAERLALAAEASGKEYSPAADLLLQGLRRSDDRAVRALALLALAKLHTRAGLLSEALAYYRLLSGQHAKDVVEGKKTGADLLEELESDRRFLPLLEAAPALPSRYVTTQERGQFETHARVLSPAGDAPAFFLANRLTFHRNDSTLRLGRGGRLRYSRKIEETFFDRVRRPEDLGHRATFPYRTLGHVAFVQLADQVVALDAVNGNVLWRRMLMPPGRRNVAEAVGVGDGTVLVTYDDKSVQLLGMELPLTAECLVLPTHDRIVAVDPLTGLTLWSRREKGGSLLLHDGVNVYSVRRDSGGKGTSTAAYRLADGEVAKVKDFAALYNRSRGVVGGRLLVAEAGEKALTLRLANLATGRDEWRQTFAAGSVAVESLKPELTGVVGPDATFHLIDSATGKGLWKVKLREEGKKPLEGVKAIRLLADPTFVFVAFERALAKDDEMVEWKSLLDSSAGLPAVPVHGKIHSHERANGRFRFYYDTLETGAGAQMLFVGREAELLPGLVLAVEVSCRRGFERVDKRPDVRVVHKRTGRILLLDRSSSLWWLQGAVLAVEADPDGRSMHLLAERAKVKITPEK
jgi:hypothetical protein